MATQNATDTSSPVSATQGGTSTATFATGDILYASATNTLSKLTATTNGYVLETASGIPAWAPIIGGTLSAGSIPVYNSSGSWVVDDAVKYSCIFDDMLWSGAALGSLEWIYNNTVSGSGAAAYANVGEDNHPGIVYLSTGTTSSGVANIRRGQTIVVGSDFIRYEALVRFPTLADGTNDYWAIFGLSEMTSSDTTPTTGVYFEYRRSNSVYWRGVGVSGGSTTRTTGTDVTVTAGSWHHLVFEINSAGTSVSFSVDGTSIGTVGSNIGTSPTYLDLLMVKTAGGTARIVDIDFVKLYFEFGSDRA